MHTNPTLFCLAFGLPLLGQDLVRDINTVVIQHPADIQSPVSWGGQVWFGADDGFHGAELWRTNGTSAGTVLAVDFDPGAQPGNPRFLQRFGSGLIFGGTQGLYTSNGVTATLVYYQESVANLRALPNTVVYSASDYSFGNELWASDGTTAGTQRLTDLSPGPVNTTVRDTLVHAGIYYFVAQAGVGPERLYRSDGTPAGTFEVAPAAAYGRCQTLGAAGPYVFFTTIDNDLWRTDGTAAGTLQLAASIMPFSPKMRAIGSRLLFGGYTPQDGAEPWVSDGTIAGTAMLRDIAPGPADGFAVYAGIGEFAGRGVFTADDGNFGAEPWITDLTPAGTMLLADCVPGAGGSFPIGYTELVGQLWFAADGEPWRSDGTAAGTFQVANIHPTGTSSPRQFTALNNRVFFVADDGVSGAEPWVSDGTGAGTAMLRDIGQRPEGSFIDQPIRAFGQRALFEAWEPNLGRELWVTDGTTAGTSLLIDASPGAAPSSHGEGVLWRGAWWSLAQNLSAATMRMVRTDGTPAGTSSFAVPGQSAYGFVGQPTVAGDRLVFMTNTASLPRLYASDGTVAGTTLLASFTVGNNGGLRPRMARLGNHAYFAAATAATGLELWRTDGTAAGTAMVVDLNPGPGHSSFRQLQAIGGRLYWQGSALPLSSFSPSDLEPWTSDGTAAGTLRLVDLSPGLASTQLGEFTAFQGQVWFVAWDASAARQLCRTDGTPAGTSAFNIGSWASLELAAAGDRLFFVDLAQIWSTDGTPAGTQVATNLDPGASPMGLVALGGSREAAFTAIDAGRRRAFATDGTPAGTRRIDLAINGTVEPTMHRIGTDLFLGISEVAVGKELFAVRLLNEGIAIADTLGEGCVGSTGVPRVLSGPGPVLGATFSIGVANALPLTLAAAAFAPNLLPGGDLTTCSVPGVDVATGVLLANATDAAGQASFAIGVPPSTTFLGAQLYTQWVVLDPNGGLINLLALSPVLRWIVGQ